MNRGIIGVTWLLALVLIASGGCSTSSKVTVAPGTQARSYRTVYLVTHGEGSADVSGYIQTALLRNGLDVSAGTQEAPPAAVDLIVTFADEWRWDLSMYLRRLNLQIYESPSRRLLASGHWENSPLHGYHGAEGVVDKVVDDTLAPLGIGSKAKATTEESPSK